MSEPRTEAGRALVRKLDEVGHMPTSGVSFPDADDVVMDIEAEARVAALAELRGQVEGLYRGMVVGGVMHSDPKGQWLQRAAVLALLPDPVTGAAAFDAAVQRAFEGTGVEVRTSFTPSDPVTEETPDPRNEAQCSICGRDIFVAWIEGVKQPWKHWVEPVPDGHQATPNPVTA